MTITNRAWQKLIGINCIFWGMLGAILSAGCGETPPVHWGELVILGIDGSDRFVAESTGEGSQIEFIAHEKIADSAAILPENSGELSPLEQIAVQDADAGDLAETELAPSDRDIAEADDPRGERSDHQESIAERPGHLENIGPEPDLADSGNTHIGKACSVNGIAGVCLHINDCIGDQKATPGYCPGPKEIQCCTPKSPPAQCDPDAKPTPHASASERLGQGGCLPGMVKVEQFCIDQYEAALVEISTGGSAIAWSPYFNPGQRKVKAVSIAGIVPQGYISGIQAAAACKQAGKRLCTSTEWLRACQGPNQHTYPYGPVLQTGLCNDSRTKHPAVEYFGSSESWVFSKLGHQCLNQLPNSLALTGSFSKCVTNENVYDMMGNLHEWVDDSSGTFRGGFYVDTWRNGPGCLYKTTAHNTAHWDYSTGFRCCADLPKP